MSLQSEIQAVQRSQGLSFEESWNFLQAARPSLFVQSSPEYNRIFAKLAPEKEKQAREKFEHIEAVARRLMARDRSLPFGVALERVRLCLPKVEAEIKQLLRPKAKEPDPTEFVQAGNEQELPPHPGQAAAIAKGLMLIEGGFCTPLHRKE
jgi:hypothetical protein